jgi:hypothetical protein
MSVMCVIGHLSIGLASRDMNTNTGIRRDSPVMCVLNYSG